MNIVSLVPVGTVTRSHLDSLAEGLAPRLRVACSIESNGLEADFAFDPLRGQYSSAEILKRLMKRASIETWRMLGVTEVDLYIPVLSFVFGHTHGSSQCAIVSLHRLRQEYYGMPADADRLRERLLKESLRQLGHTLGLRHCPDYRCVMSPSHTVESIDLKRAEFCATCGAASQAR